MLSLSETNLMIADALGRTATERLQLLWLDCQQANQAARIAAIKVEEARLKAEGRNRKAARFYAAAVRANARRLLCSPQG